jgi:uroporphyrinogen-III synthase
MTPVLSTRLLNSDQKNSLREAKYQLAEYNAIAIDLLDFKLPKGYTHYIFTSKNGVISYLQHLEVNALPHDLAIRCFCVGQKTKAFLEEKELKVVKMTENALELANFITKHHQNEEFLIFKGNRNRPDLRNIFTRETIHFKEVEVYQTSLVPRQFKRIFAAILFYSPSGVESFTRQNIIGNTPVFCIGETTAKEARKYSKHVIVAENSTVDSTLQALIHTLPTLLKQ